MASKGIIHNKLHIMDVETAVSCHRQPLLTRAATDQVMSVNRRLMREIETLKLKMDTETKLHENSKLSLMVTSKQKMKTRELEIENLKSELKKKDNIVQGTSQGNEEKQVEIAELQNYVEQLKEDVRASKVYAEQIQTQLDCFELEKAKLESGEMYTEKDEEVVRLQTEVNDLKINLRTLEEELVYSKETIVQNGWKLRRVETDKINMHLQFKDELAKISQSMRREMENVKDVMDVQWREMKMLREQNEGLRSDIREVKDLLVAEMSFKNKQPGEVAEDVRQKPPRVYLPSGANNRQIYQRGRKK